MEAWFETALEEPYTEVIKKVGFPAVNTRARFRKPCHVGDEVFVMLSLSELERSSITLNFRVIDGGEAVRATGSVSCVSIGVAKGEFHFKAIRIPENLRVNMAKFLTIPEVGQG